MLHYEAEVTKHIIMLNQQFIFSSVDFSVVCVYVCIELTLCQAVQQINTNVHVL